MPTDQGILNQQKADKSQASVSITNYFDTEPNSSSFVAERDEARHSLQISNLQRKNDLNDLEENESALVESIGDLPQTLVARKMHKNQSNPESHFSKRKNDHLKPFGNDL